MSLDEMIPARVDQDGRRFMTDHNPPAPRIVPFAASKVLSVVAVRLRTAIDVLPRNAGDVAVWLTERGIRGDMGCAGACPLARYLTLRCGHPIVVDGHAVSATNHDWQFTHALPAHLSEFVTEFDSAAYPSLLAQTVQDA
jgi:hypothetical protein